MPSAAAAISRPIDSDCRRLRDFAAACKNLCHQLGGSLVGGSNGANRRPNTFEETVMMPLMSLSSLLNILRPARRAPAGIPGDDNLDVEAGEPEPKRGASGYLVARDGRVMPLRGVSLRAQARGGVARVVLEQRFENPYPEALHVTYLMPLPAEAAVSGYAFALGGKRIVGEVDKKQRARQRFEQAIVEGKTAGLVEQERSSLFTQELGNVPPGAEVVAELTIDQKLLWRREGMWEWRFPTAVGPRYMGAPGEVADAARLEVPVAERGGRWSGPERGIDARLALSLAIRDVLPSASPPESPSHRLRSSAAGSCVDVSLASEDGARLDRDVVVRWPVAGGAVGTSLDLGRPAGQRDSYGLLTLVPPEVRWQRPARRDLILLLDTSGSMDGDPLRQLKRTALALIDSLGGGDTLEMIEFSSTARRWNRGAREATSATKREARSWVEGLSAGGGTEMVSGMLEALAPLTERSQRQVILMTDGYIGGERQVIAQVMQKLPRGSCRVHVVGVGSSVNRTLTSGVARAGAGVELILAPGEDAERLVGGLLARTAAPLLTHVEVKGNALLANAPAYLPDLYAGSPALISLQLRAEGGSLEVTGHGADGPWRAQVTVPACEEGQGTQALAALFARETVEDLELAHATTTTDHAAIDRAIEDLGLRFQISTRLTTWVAVSQEATVDPSRPGRRDVVAHEVPQGVSVAGLGLRPAGAQPSMAQPVMAAPMSVPPQSIRGAMPRSQVREEARKTFMVDWDLPPAAASGSAAAPPPARPSGSAAAPPPARPSPAPRSSEREERESADGVPEEPTAASSVDVDFFRGGRLGSAESGEAPPPAPMQEPMAKKERARDEKAKDAEEGRRQPEPLPGSPSRVTGVSRAASIAPAGMAGFPAGPLGDAGAGPVVSTLRARLRNLTPDGIATLEITVTGELTWSTGADVLVELGGGRAISAAVRQGTTAAGTYVAGQVLRLVIDVAAARDEKPLAVWVAGRLIPIVME
jgi:Ca-activated chloride channel homolog